MSPTRTRTYVWTWVALLALLALTCGSSFIPLAGFNLLINLAVAVAKALLVVVIFMKVGSGGPVIRMVALAGIAWLSLLVILSLGDFATRGP